MHTAKENKIFKQIKQLNLIFVLINSKGQK